MQAESAYLSALTAVEGLKETEDGTSKHELLQFVEEVGNLILQFVCVLLGNACIFLLFNQSFDLPDEKKKQLQDKVTTLEKPTVTLTCRGKIMLLIDHLSMD